eukprot:1948320-Rhodomonas_salina.1
MFYSHLCFTSRSLSRAQRTTALALPVTCACVTPVVLRALRCEVKRKKTQAPHNLNVFQECSCIKLIAGSDFGQNSNATRMKRASFEAQVDDHTGQIYAQVLPFMPTAILYSRTAARDSPPSTLDPRP